jgi:hypothetical protein
VIYFKIRNFEQFQHYKHRNPPWIKLYYNLLHDRRFFRLDDSSKYLAIGLFLIASQNNNKIAFDEEWIKKELSLSTPPNWQALVESEFIQPIDCDASVMLATCQHDASVMLAREEKRREETEILSFSSKSPKSNYLDAIEVLKYWNLMAGTMHHRALNGQEKAINQTMRKYTKEEICRAIERYSPVRENKEGKYRDLYAWTLSEFLTRQNGYNLERFNAENWEDPFVSKEFFGNNHSKQITPRLATPEEKTHYNPNARD